MRKSKRKITKDNLKGTTRIQLLGGDNWGHGGGVGREKEKLMGMGKR